MSLPSLRAVLLALVCFPCGGCLIGPDFQPVEVTFQEEWITTEDRLWDKSSRWLEIGTRESKAVDIWSEVFHDEPLESILSQVSLQNYDLRSAEYLAQRVAAGAGIAAAALFPDVSLEPTMSRRGTSAAARAAAGRFPRRTFNNFIFSSIASWELDLWGRVRRDLEAAHADTAASLQTNRDLEVSLQAEAATLYFGLRAVASSLDILKRSVALREESLALAEAQFAAGATDSLDVERAKAELATTQVSLQEQTRLQKRGWLSLGRLVGSVLPYTVEAILPLRIESLVLPRALPGEVVANRPDVQAELERVRSANARIGVAKAAFFPRLSLTASGGFQSARSQEVFKSPSRIWSLGPRLSLPLFRGGRNRATLAAAEADYLIAVERYKSQVIRALVEVEQALVDTQSFRQQVEDQTEVIRAAQEARRLSQRRYELGLVSFLEVLDTQRTELQAELSGMNLLGRFYGSVVDLIRALGGTWKVEVGKSELS